MNTPAGSRVNAKERRLSHRRREQCIKPKHAHDLTAAAAVDAVEKEEAGSPLHQRGHRREANPQWANVCDYRDALDEAQVGCGTPESAFDLPLREQPNESGCMHCPTTWCDCLLFDQLLAEAVAETPLHRVVEVAGKNHLCAKSVLPPFVSRMVALFRISPADVFYDLGSGNGSVCFQVAFLTGCRVIGVELSPHNAQLSREIWAHLRPRLEAATGRAMPEVSIVTADLAHVIGDQHFGEGHGNVAIWTANLLMPRSLTHYMSEKFRTLPVGSRIMCLDDLYPHGRAASRSRDPEAFALFEMTDFVWPPLSVEWMAGGGGRFYRHVRR